MKQNRTYIIEKIVGGIVETDQFPASSWEDAEEFALKHEVTLIGRLEKRDLEFENQISAAMEELKNTPIQFVPTKEKTMVMDVEILPSEYKNCDTLKEGLLKYQEDFGVKVIPVDSCRQNGGGKIVIPL